jgi:hypothetical protein
LGAGLLFYKHEFCSHYLLNSMKQFRACNHRRIGGIVGGISLVFQITDSTTSANNFKKSLVKGADENNLFLNR